MELVRLVPAAEAELEAAPERMSISAHSSAIRSGCSKGAMTTAVPMRALRVSRASAPASGASEGTMP